MKNPLNSTVQQQILPTIKYTQWSDNINYSRIKKKHQMQLQFLYHITVSDYKSIYTHTQKLRNIKNSRTQYNKFVTQLGR